MNIKRYLSLFKKESIARRYFVMNSFEGTLTVMGIVMAFFIVGSDSSGSVIISTVGAAVAMGVSGIWGAYSIERAERRRSLKSLEKHMMKSLKKSSIGERMDELSLVLATINGLSPAIISLIIITPFIFFPISYAYYISLGIVGVTLFFIGVFVGKVGKRNLLISGIKMLLAGLVVGLICVGLELINVI